MAEQIISPGVFTRENDLSFLPAGVGAIGAAIVGPTEKGPAFVPTVVNSFAEFDRRFGPLSSGTVTVCRVLAGGGYRFSSTSSPAYLAAGNVGVGSSAIESGFIVENYLSDKAILLTTLFPSKNVDTPDLSTSKIVSASISGSDLVANFKITLKGTQGGSHITAGTSIFSASLNPTNQNYLPKQLGYTSDNSKNGVISYTGKNCGYAYSNFRQLQSAALTATLAAGTSVNGFTYPTLCSSSIVTVVKQSSDMDFSGSIANAEMYSYASTPMIQSGFVDAIKTVKDLFKFHTINHGDQTNTDFKISIANLKTPDDIDNEEQYSRFSVLVRKFGDTDKNPVILEQYNNLTLDPDSPNYISRRIGDRFPQYNDTLGKVELLGNYPNISEYVRVEVDASVDAKSTSPKLAPKGFAAVINPIATSSLSLNVMFPSASYEATQSLGTDLTYNAKGFLGWRFMEKDKDNWNWIRPLPSTQESNSAGTFNVDNYFGHASSSLWSGSLSASITATGASGPTANQLKFSVPFQGGQDGVAPYVVKFTGAESELASKYTDGDNLYGFDMNTTNAAGYKGYKKAIDILSNQDEYDINMLALPGVIKQYHSLVANAGIDMCEDRGDAFFVMDLASKEASVNEAVNQVSGLDSNYAAVYYPWVKVLDVAANKPVFVPPSVIVPGAIAASDRIGAEWFAPAGLNRGILGNVIEAKIRLNQAERDVLYDSKINPIATFPQTGVCIWGQKTLQERSTALDRINVRRLLIALKKFIASSSRYLVFEQNTLQTRTRFLNIVNPYLESVQQRQGLYAFRVQMDESNNTPTVIDRNQLVGAIYLQPTKTAEFIILDFNVLPTGATFDTGGGAGY